MFKIMGKLVYGKDYWLKFKTDSEKYASIGFVCNGCNCNITIEDNATRGSYTDAYRIKIKNDCTELPGLTDAMRDSERINCNESIEDLLHSYRFVCNDGVHVFGDYNTVRSTISTQFLKDFDYGYNL